LVFRVDSYGPDSRDKGELVLMDAHGRCLLTVRRKVLPSLPRSLSLYIYIYIYIWMNDLTQLVLSCLLN
jgi:hypothetical protein